jgi:hypothetical protein
LLRVAFFAFLGCSQAVLVNDEGVVMALEVLEHKIAHRGRID